MENRGLELSELSRIHLAEPLVCGLAGCAALTTSGLLEPDPRTRGLWRLLPICGACSASLQGSRERRLERLSREERGQG